MATRDTYTSASSPAPSGIDLVDQMATRFGQLFDAIVLEPTSISNSGNDYTIVIDPELQDEVLSGMAFYITPNATNTGATRLRVTASGTYYDWVSKTGADLASGDLDISTTYLVAFIGGSFKTLTEIGAAAGGSGTTIDYEAFTASGTWNKRSGLSDSARILVECWGGGGGGGEHTIAGGGGGGGGYSWRWFLGSELSTSETVTVGAGGSGGVSGAGSVGGNTTFGSLITAYGGAAGAGDAFGDAGGGGGGGQLSAGQSALGSSGGAGGSPIPGSASSTSGANTGGGGAGTTTGGRGMFGGGGGGGGANPTGGNGGNTWYGGGGGGGNGATTGGTSTFGGAGGDGTSAGTAPGGGGGGSTTTSGAGARGEVRVWTIG